MWPWFVLLGLLLAVGAWQARAAWQARRVIGWLREGADPAQAPVLRGAWGEAAQRLRRLQRQHSQRAAASEARLQDFLAALQASPNGVVLLDAQGHIEWFNQQAAQHFGLEAERDRQQAIGNLLREPAFAAYCAQGDFTQDLVLAGRDSTPTHPVRLALRLHPYGEGRRLMLVRDFTAIEQADAMRRDFVANVSHEIRTPLTVLAGFVETLQTLELTPDERARYLGLMARQAARMQSLVQDLLTLSRLEGSPLPDRAEWTPVQRLLRHVTDEARTLSAALRPEHAAAQTLEFPSDAALQAAGELAGSASELQSALSNLVTNAVRYTPAGGRVSVQWQPLARGGARFVVQDSGPGIAAEHLPRLTERFYRVDPGRSRDNGGTGLGLAIVKHVLQRHGAQLHIASVVGQGSMFSVDFPLDRWRTVPPPLPYNPPVIGE